MPLNSAKLQSTNVELQEIINNSWDGICILDKQTKFIYVNDAFSPMLGCSKEEFLKENFLSFIEKKEDKTAFLQLLKDNVLNAYNTDINVVCQRKDGKPIYLKITVALMMNKKYFVINAKDITKEISDEEILNDYVLSFHTNTNGIINKVSQAFCKLSGYKKEALIGQNFASLKHDEQNGAIFIELLEKLKHEQELTQRLFFAKSNDDKFVVDMTMKPIFNKYGDVTGFTALMFDVTTELFLDQQLSIENHKLEIMSETIKTISHEWRQPLNIISLKAQTLQFDLEDENIITSLDEIKNTSESLSSTIEEFQNILKYKGEAQEIDIEVFLKECIDKFSAKNTHNIKFEINNAINTHKNVYTKALKHVLTNLFKNSLEAFTLNEIKEPCIQVETYYKNNTIQLNVTDNAGGISPSILPKIFEPYFSTKEKRHGVGLGLYKCKMLVQMHLGGDIEAKNINKGVLFEITLPEV